MAIVSGEENIEFTLNINEENNDMPILDPTIKSDDYGAITITFGKAVSYNYYSWYNCRFGYGEF